MSRGTKVVTFRIPTEIESAVDSAIAHRNEHSREEPWTWSDFVKIALTDKVKHMERSRSKNRGKKNAKPKKEGTDQ